jgi:hypothetical protein
MRSSVGMAVSGAGDGRGGDVAVGGDSEADGLEPAGGGGIGLSEFVVGGGEADLESFGFAGPAFAFGFGDAGEEVVADFFEAVPLGGVDAQEGAADAGVLVDAAGAVGSAAVAEGDAAALEVTEELLPLGVGGGAVFLAGAELAAAADEGAVAVDGFLGVDRLWPMVVLMSSCPSMSWAMWGGMPLRMASVVKTLRKSCGQKVRGLPSVPVMPEAARAPARRLRIPSAGMGRFSRPMRRWNSSGIGGFQVRSRMS